MEEVDCATTVAIWPMLSAEELNPCAHPAERHVKRTEARR